MFNFWEYRQGQEEEGKAFGVVPFSTKAYYAGVRDAVFSSGFCDCRSN